MTALFAAAVLQRDRLRSQWWAWRLVSTADPRQQAYYLALLAAVGDSASGAIAGLAADDDPAVRSLAVVALAALPEGRGVDRLAALLADPDGEVSSSAAVCLAFMADESPAGGRGLDLLIEAAGRPDTGPAAAAAAALSRVSSPAALNALGRVAARHPSAWVRAQAVESLATQAAVRLRPIVGADASPVDFPRVGSGDIIDALVASLLDDGRFTGELAFEREIARAARFAGSSPASGPAGSGVPTDRRVADVAAAGLSVITGRYIEPADAPAFGSPAEFAAQCRAWVVERRHGDNKIK